MEIPFPIFPAKLREPDPGAYLKRNRLFRRLDAARTPLVVVHADAGYGKTTLVSSYLRERARPAIWYHLGTTDRVWASPLAHIRQGVAEAFPSALTAGTDPLEAAENPELAGATLAALFGQTGASLALVLEDYHRVEDGSQIHLVISAMVDHLPTGAQVFLLSRTRPPLPTSRLTLSGRALVLTRHDLAFTFEETAALFARVYSGSLTHDELALVERRLEGWPVGLRLTHEALRVRRDEDRGRFWASFCESPALFEYLADEVLGALPGETSSFLQQTSIFSVLQPDLIDEFLPGCRAATTLERLAKENFFTAALSGATTRYRYHALLRQCVQRQLIEGVGPDGLRKLHARAAELYARRGEIDYAIGHSLAAGEYKQVTRLVERLADRHGAEAVLRLMEGWLERAFPGMEGASGIALRRLIPMSVYESIIPDLRRVAEDADQLRDPITQAHAQQRLGVYLYLRGELEECIPWLEQSRNTLRAAGHLVPASISSTTLGLALIHRGTPKQAERLVADALEWAGEDAVFATMNAHFANAELALAQGKYEEAEDWARAGVASTDSFQIGGVFIYGTLAIALLHQGRTEDALEACTNALSHAERYGIPDALGFVHARLAMALRAAGKLHEARRVVGKAIEQLQGYDFLLSRAMLLRADLAEETGDPSAPGFWAETRSFWQKKGYRFHPVYDGIVGRTLLALGGWPVSAEAHGVTASVASPWDGAPLEIRTLGTFRLRVQGRDCDPSSWGRAPARRLFFYLLVHRGRLVHRDEILEALWPEDDPAASAVRLKSAVYVLRRELGHLSRVVDRQGHTYRLRLPPTTELDADRYLALIEDGLTKGNQAALREAADLYQGDFLAEFPYDEFLERERTRLRTLQLKVLLSLADAARRDGQLDQALACYAAAQKLDPLLEEPVLRTMEVLLCRGESPAAVATYLRYRAELQLELGINPPLELRQLYDRCCATTSAGAD